MRKNLSQCCIAFLLVPVLTAFLLGAVVWSVSAAGPMSRNGSLSSGNSGSSSSSGSGGGTSSPGSSGSGGGTSSPGSSSSTPPAPGDTLVELTGALNKNTVAALKTGDTDTLSFTVTAKWGDGNASTVSQNAAYSWSIGNSNIATITPNLRTNSATLKGVNPGTTTVTVTATYKDKTTAAATCTVTVIQRMGSIRITPTGPLTMEENEQQELKATTDPAGEVVSWSVTDTEPEGS